MSARGPGGSGQRRPRSAHSLPPFPTPVLRAGAGRTGKAVWGRPGRAPVPAGCGEASGRRAAAVPQLGPATSASLTELFPSRSGPSAPVRPARPPSRLFGCCVVLFFFCCTFGPLSLPGSFASCRRGTPRPQRCGGGRLSPRPPAAPFGSCGPG